MIKNSKAISLLSDCARSIRREVKVSLTRVPDNKWIFIVGCYNSGTTLLAEMLGAHRQISALETEGHFITDQFIKDYEIGLPRMWVDREDLFTLNENSAGPDPIRVKKEWAMRLDKNKEFLLEKSPPNVPKMRWLNKHFHSPYFIGIVRNGYAVSEGITRKGNPMHLKTGWPIEKSAYQWKRSNEVLLDNANHVENFLLIKYEELTEQTSETLNQITDFIGADRFDSSLGGRNWNIHERMESVRNMNHESISRLNSREIEIIRNIAGDLLGQFGYSDPR